MANEREIRIIFDCCMFTIVYQTSTVLCAHCEPRTNEEENKTHTNRHKKSIQSKTFNCN